MGLHVFLACIRPASLPDDSPPAITVHSPQEKIRRKSNSHSWRPSLGAISEDRAAVAAKAANPLALLRSSSARPAAADYGKRFDQSRSARPAAGLGRSRSVSSGSVGRILPRGKSDRWGLGLPVIVPAFAPTGFMF